MSDSLCDAVDRYITAVHNMHVRITWPWGIWVEARMRRAMPGIAILAAGLMLLAGCNADRASSGGPAPSTNGIGPITFAIGKDNFGWLQGVITGWNKGHPSQNVTLLLLPRASNGQLAQLVANLQAN